MSVWNLVWTTVNIYMYICVYILNHRLLKNVWVPRTEFTKVGKWGKANVLVYGTRNRVILVWIQNG